MPTRIVDTFLAILVGGVLISLLVVALLFSAGFRHILGRLLPLGALLVGMVAAFCLGGMLFPPLQGLSRSLLHYAQGALAVVTQHHAAAEQHYLQALAGFPQPERLYMDLGDLAAMQRAEQKAFGYYQKALALNPNAHEVRLKLARYLAREGDHTLALHQYEEALEHAPQDLDLRRETGDLYLALARKTHASQEYQQAQKHLGLVIQHDGEDDLAMLKQGECLYALKRYEDAMTVYCRLAQKHPDKPEALYSLAMTFQKLHAPKEAAQLLTQAAEWLSGEQPELAAAWNRQAIRLRQGLDPQKAPPAVVSPCWQQLETTWKKTAISTESQP